MQILEPIYSTEKEAFIAQKCTEMEALAYKTTSRNLKFQGETDQGLLQAQITKLEQDLMRARENGVAQGEQERQEWIDKALDQKKKAETTENMEISLSSIRT